MALDVICIGHACYDMSFPVDSYPLENSKCEIHHLTESGGGPAANAAFLLSSWGVSCGFAGVIGDDSIGQQVRAEFKSVRTDLGLLQVIPGQPTALSAIIINRQNGSRTIINRKSRDLRMAGDFGFGEQNPKVLLLDGHELAASEEALKKWPNAISILDAGSLRDSTTKLAACVNILAASERFATQLTGQDDLKEVAPRAEAIRRLKKRFAGPKTIIVTAGEAGLSWSEGPSIQHMLAFPVHAVDTTAAGDIFHGALAYASLTQMRQEQALLFASMTAALSVTKSGGRSSIPSLIAVQEALADAR